MKFDIGTIIAIAAVLLFYLRLILLQRQKGKSVSSNPPASSKKAKKRNVVVAESTQLPQTTGLVIANGFLVGAGVILILLGVAANFFTELPPTVRGAWWLPVSLGVLLMGLGIR